MSEIGLRKRSKMTRKKAIPFFSVPHRFVYERFFVNAEDDYVSESECSCDGMSVDLSLVSYYLSCRGI